MSICLIIPLFDRNDHPFAPTCLRQSAARSGSQGCRRECGGTGGAGASLTERARCYPSLEALHHTVSRGVTAPLFFA